jgi:putative transposase
MRLPRLFAPEQVQIVEIRFTTGFTTAWENPATHELLPQLAKWLGEYGRTNQVTIHAWSLTSKRLCLLATACDGQSLGRLMQGLGRRLAARLQVGSVFDGRFRSALVEPGRWALPAQCWVERAPLVDGLTNDPAGWLWSSANQHTGTQSPTTSGAFPAFDITLTDHPDYWACGNTPFDRQAKYKELLLRQQPAAECRAIEQAVKGQWALGSADFIQKIQKIATRRVMPNKRGRPRKSTPSVPRKSVPV